MFRYKLRQDYLVEHGGYENEDWVVHTPVLKSFASDKLTPEQAQATLEYFLLRLVQILNIFHFPEADRIFFGFGEIFCYL